MRQLTHGIPNNISLVLISPLLLSHKKRKNSKKMYFWIFVMSINYFLVFIFVFVWVIPTSLNTQATVNDDQNVGLNNNILNLS